MPATRLAFSVSELVDCVSAGQPRTAPALPLTSERIADTCKSFDRQSDTSGRARPGQRKKLDCSARLPIRLWPAGPAARSRRWLRNAWRAGSVLRLGLEGGQPAKSNCLAGFQTWNWREDCGARKALSSIFERASGFRRLSLINSADGKSKTSVCWGQSRTKRLPGGSNAPSSRSDRNGVILASRPAEPWHCGPRWSLRCSAN